jgi:DNA (cytosine-5)-methyltransferase 1
VNELALFAGAGGGILGGCLLGWRTVAAVEIEEYPRAVLLQRQADGILPKFPIWDDIRTFDGKPWRGKVDIVTGGFPCQDISAAGKGAGIEGERSGLWSEMARVIGEVRPWLALVENSPMLTSRGLGTVLRDLAEMGYNARWCVLGADDAGAPHRRKRIWILAYAAKQSRQQGEGWTKKPERRETSQFTFSCQVGNTFQPGLEGQSGNESDGNQSGRDREKEDRSACPSGISWWDIDPADLPDTGCNNGNTGDISELSKNTAEWASRTIQDQSGYQGQGWAGTTKSGLGRMVDGLSGNVDIIESAFGGQVPRVGKSIENRVDRLKAIGNGQVPLAAAIAFLILSEGL